MSEEANETIYDEEGKDETLEDSEVSPEEEGFMRGYDDAADDDDDDDEHPEDI